MTPQDRRQANRAVAVSAVGLAATGVAELLIALLTGSVGLLGDAIHNLSDVSTSAVVFLGFRLSRRPPTERYPYGLERAEDLAGIGIAVVIWASAAFAGAESIRKLVEHGHTSSPRPRASPARCWASSATRSWPGTSSSSAAASDPRRWSLTPGTPGWTPCPRPGRWPGWSRWRWASRGATRSPGSRSPCSSATSATRSPPTSCAAWPTASTPRSSPRPRPQLRRVPGIIHAHARARWTGRTLRVEIEGWVGPDQTTRDADAIGRQVARAERAGPARSGQPDLDQPRRPE